MAQFTSACQQLASEYKDYEPVFHPVVSLVKTQSLLQKRYFNEKSHGCFIYQQASFLVNNIFVKEYRNLYVEKKAQGYTKEELKKLFAFQYFETESQAKQVFQYGVHFATSTITTLGDPAKGVYVSKYSDYLHPRPWYHGKSGFIVIFKFLKGKVKAVCENYTDNYTLPTPGYDCHISEYIDGYSEKSSHFRSFELTQYYVYEICNDHFRRPRQLCPLVIVAFQYIELRRNMPVLQDTEMVNNPEFYNAWKGQMFIQDQLVCDIALQSSGNSSIPTHLSDKLEIREVIRLSELKQKLPDVIFEKAEFTGQEVCCGDVFYSIYQVVTSNVVGSELEKLQKWMKDQELAIVKFLNDQGFLVLITSPKIKTSKDLQQSDSTCLTALFLFPHSKSLATKDIEQWGKDVPREEISRQVTTLLPGLQYAIMETNRTLKEKELYPDALERCFKKFAVLQKKKDSPSEDKEALSPLTEVSPNTENSTSEKCSPLEFDRLQSYISAPVNYCVPVVKASILLVGEAAFSSNSLDLSNCGSDLTDALQTKLCLEDKTNNEPPVTEVSNDKALLQEKEKPIATTSTKGKGPKRRMKRGKRRRLHSTKKAYTHPEIKKNSLQSKDKIQNISLSRTTLKLFSAQCSQGRKRGAEVLTAEFIQDTSPERPQKRLPIKRPRRTSKNVLPSRRSERTPKKRPPEVPVEPGNPPKRKILEQGESSGDKNVPETSDPSVGKIEKVKKPRRNMDTTKTVVRGQGKTFSKPAENGGVEDAHILEKRLNMYESHALNLLADLALNSFNSSSIPFAPTESVESENAGLAEKKDVPVETPSNDHENPMDNNAEPPCIPPVPSSAPAPPPPEEPAPITEAPPEPPESTKVSCEAEESPQPNKEHRKKQKPQKSPVLSKVPIDQASKISMEHSYSHLPTDEQTPEPAPSKSPEPAVQAAPDSPVLPQATEVVIQQSPNSVILSGEIIFVTSTNQVLCPVVKPEARSVLKLGDKFLITFSSDAKYDFDLDSKFTSDPLEKTINRALHGPWNPNLKEKVEDVKIILHMWLALFYSKSNKQLNRRTRKVVEHSNPAKYVSINTALDPFELYKFVESESINIGLTPLPPCASSSHNPGVILPYANAIHSPYPGKLPLPALPRIPKPEKIHLKQEAKEIKRELKNDGKPGSQRSVTQIQKKTTLPTVTYTTNESSKEEKATENRDGCIPIVCYISDAKHSAPDTQLNCKAESADLANTATEKVNNGEHSTEVSSTSLIQDVMDHEFDTCQEIVTSQETYVSDERKDKFETLFGSQSEAEVGPLQDDQLVSSTRPCIEPDKKAWPKLGINDLNMDAHIPSPVTACHSDSSSDGYSTPPRSATNLYIPPVVEGKVAHVERGLTYMPIIGFGSNSAVRLSDTIASRQTSAACAWPKVEVAKTENHIPPIDFLHANNRTKECCTVYKASDIVTSKVLEILKQVPKVSTESLTPRCEESKLSQSEAALVELPAQTQDNEDISCKTSTDNLVSLDLESTQPLLSPKHSGVDVIVHEVTVSKTKQVVNMDLMISEPVDVTSLRLWENQPAVVVEKIHQLGENEPWSHSSFFSNYASSIDGIVDSIGAEDTGSLNLESSREEQKICSLTVKESKVEEKQVSPELICLSPNPNNELCDALVETGSNKQSHDNYTPIFLDEAKYPCTETKQLSVKNDRLDENSNQQFESLGENLSPASMQPTDEIPDTNNVKETDSYEPNQVGSQTSSLGDINMDLSAVHMIDQSELVISQTKSASLDPESSTQDPQTCPLSNKVTLVDVEQNNSSSQEELLASQYLLDKAEATGVNLFLLENSEKLPSHPEGKLSQTEECEVVVLDSNSSPSSVEAFEESDGLSLQRSCTPSIQDVYGYEHMDSVSTREPSDICLIANIASISEEQYERWDDEDVSQVNKETQKTISDQKYYQMISHSTSENTQESTCTAKSKSTRYLQKRSSSRPRLRETDEYFPWHHREADYQNPRDYGNFTVTKSLKESGRTLQSSHREVGLLSHKRFVNGDLTQNTIDLEHLRFIHRLKRVLRNTSSDDFLYETPYLTMFESKRIPGCSNSSSKSTSPMLITVHCSESRREPRGHDQWYAGSYYTQRVCDDELRDRPAYYSRTPKKVRPRTHRNVSPFPLNRLMYESSSEDLDNGFSVALKDSVQSNHLRLSRVGLGNSKVDRTTARDLLEKSTVQTRKTFVPSSKDSHVVKNIISDHCTRIQSKLSSVIKESAKRNFRFYIIETSDDPFFTLTKNLLKKDGHTSVEPQHFSHSQHESERLLVIIRIEDISSHIHKIPCLLQLKLSPNVAFAGVDNPEDVTESTYEELFQAGGFVVSDPTLLETITLGKLKEVLAVLEKMNKSSAWKWLVHYRENKRLKEDKRSDSASQVKISLLKSYQQMNVIEILPYHQCDSTGKEQPEDLTCALTLQSQRIHSRLAVYLTESDKLSATREEFEQNGILAFDVDTFIRSLQKLDARVQSSCWP